MKDGKNSQVSLNVRQLDLTNDIELMPELDWLMENAEPNNDCNESKIFYEKAKERYLKYDKVLKGISMLMDPNWKGEDMGAGLEEITAEF